MPVYHVSYDLNGDNRNYDDIITPIKESLGHYHILRSSWLVYTNENAAQLFDRLRLKLKTTDRLFISHIDADKQGWLDKPAWDWLNARINC